jgi:small subunit ribosomal protein S4e
VIGTGNKPMVSLPKGKGLRMSIVEELEKRKEK